MGHLARGASHGQYNEEVDLRAAWLVHRDAHFTRLQLLLAGANDDSGILANGQSTEDWIDARKHRFSVSAKKEHCRFRSALPETTIAIRTGSFAQSTYHCLEIQLRVDLIR
jgi:hypothetical protein